MLVLVPLLLAVGCLVRSERYAEAVSLGALCVVVLTVCASAAAKEPSRDYEGPLDGGPHNKPRGLAAAAAPLGADAPSADPQAAPQAAPQASPPSADVVVAVDPQPAQPPTPLPTQPSAPRPPQPPPPPSPPAPSAPPTPPPPPPPPCVMPEPPETLISPYLFRRTMDRRVYTNPAPAINKDTRDESAAAFVANTSEAYASLYESGLIPRAPARAMSLNPFFVRELQNPNNSRASAKGPLGATVPQAPSPVVLMYENQLQAGTFTAKGAGAQTMVNHWFRGATPQGSQARIGFELDMSRRDEAS